MINLLPSAAKKHLAREHRLRLWSLYLLMAAMVAATLFFLSLPTWILLRHQADALAHDGPLAAEVGKRMDAAEARMTKTAAILEHLSSNKNRRAYADTIARLDALAGAEVSISEFAFDAKNKLIISGTAATRAPLSSFRTALQADSAFKTVDLPLSSLVKDTATPFSITITFHQP